jgi:hypothetical protein
MGVPGSAAAATVSAETTASDAARTSGKPVLVGSLTTPTETVTAEPRGDYLLTESLLPTRVRQQGRWVAVSTALRRSGNGLTAAALPGDLVSFSRGGRLPLAVLTAGRSRVELWWPGRLPVPVMKGSQATYRSVLPGIDLVLTAESAAAGGFSAVLVIRNRTAATDPGLARLAFRVTATGTRLGATDGGLTATAAGKAGEMSLAPSAMWDSSALKPSAQLSRVASAPVRRALAAAKAAGAQVAAPGAGPGGAAGPAGGARVARLTARVSGAGSASALTIVPDRALLSSLSTVYPVYAAVASATLQPATAVQAAQAAQAVQAAQADSTVSSPNNNVTGDKQHYDEVQSACPTAQNEDSQHTKNDNPDPYWSLGVGYDAYPGGDCNGSAGYAYAYYQLKVPSELNNATLEPNSTLKTWETWSAACSATTDVSASLTAGINSGTSWNSIHAGSDTWNITHLDTEEVAADTSKSDSNCDSTSPVDDTSCGPGSTAGQCANYLAAVFQLGTGSAISNALTNGAASMTFRLLEPFNGDYASGNGNDLYFKRFAQNPWMQIYYDHPPGAPTEGEVSEDGGTYHACVGAVPAEGKATNGVTMRAKFTDPDGDEMTPTFRYKAGSGSWNPVTGANVNSGNTSTALIPASWLNGQAPGTVISWQAQATDGELPGPWMATSCTFAVYPSAPPKPTIGTPGSPTGCPSGTPAGTIMSGCKLSFTVTSNDTTADPAVQLVWGLDGDPSPTSPPAGEVMNFNGAKSLTVTITVPSPGPHQLDAYIVDSGGNDSPDADPPGAFTASQDSWPTAYASFSAALGAGEPFDNTMISTASGQSGKANGDGSGDSIDEALLSGAGWKPNTSVTVDGATFPLPGFGTTGSGPDNILAAGQTIDLPAGSQGSSLVFLATSTDSDGLSPLYGSGTWPAHDYTAPYVPGNSPVTGEQCDPYQATQGACQIPSGSITYANAATAPNESYYLTVPDWLSGPQFASAVLTGGEDTASGQNQNEPIIYAFSVPLNPAVAVSSVTLPDIGAAISAASGIAVPALHIFGIAVANTTTATPGTTEGALTGGQTWTGAWESPMSYLGCPDSTCGNDNVGEQTFREVVTLAAGGPSLRLRLSDDQGSEYAVGAPLTIGSVTIAEPGSGAAVTAGTVTPVTFGASNSASVSIPEGGDVYSNPVTPQGFSLTAGSKVTVSVYLTNSMDYLVQHDDCSACSEYATAFGSGNAASATSSSGFTSYGQESNIVAGVDVQTAGIPTVVVLGDNVIFPDQASPTLAATAPRMSDELAAEEIAAGTGGVPAFSVVSAGVPGNDLLNDSGASPSALTALAEDILTEPNVGTVIVDEGLQDLVDGEQDQYGDSLTTTASDLMDYRYPELFSLLQAWGDSAVATSLTPCYGMAGGACTAGGTGTTTDGERLAVNEFLASNYNNFSGPCITASAGISCQYFDDIDAQVAQDVADGSSTVEQLIPADSESDGVNLTAAGYSSASGIASAVPVNQLTANTPPEF